MASFYPKKNKQGVVTGYKIMACVGRDERYKQIWKTCTIKRSDPRLAGLTPAKERKEIQAIAHEWEAVKKAEYEAENANTDKNKITFADFVAHHWWSDYVLDGTHKPNTVSFFKQQSDYIVAYFGPKKRLQQVDAEAIRRLIKYLRTEAKTRQGKPYSETTVQHYFRTMNNIMDYAARYGYIEKNPCEKLQRSERPHKEGKTKVDYLDIEEAKNFKRCLKNESTFWQCYFNILMVCGLRRGEALGLQWRDLDDEKLLINVQRSVTIDRSAPKKYSVVTPKNGEAEPVAMTQRILDMLNAFREEQEQEPNVHPIKSNSFIFHRACDPSEPIYPTTPTTYMRRFTKKYNLQSNSPHDLRHTAATFVLLSGGNMKDAQQHMRHKDPAITMKFYAGVSQEVQRRTAQNIDALLAEDDSDEADV